MSFYSDWAAAQDGSLDPVSGKPSAVHGKEVGSAYAGEEHRHKATNDPRLPANVTATPAAPPAPKKRNRWGGGGDE